jgi:formamidopyrimidine-DNA glycosylase
VRAFDGQRAIDRNRHIHEHVRNAITFFVIARDPPNRWSTHVPELPEVERAVVALRRHLVGRRIVALELHHAALARRMTPKQRRSVSGSRVIAVRRRGKHQLIELDDRRVLHAHFRMTGNWLTGAAASKARYPRATLTLEDGSRVVLDDPRALSTVELDQAGADPTPGIGPDADDPSLDTAWLAERFATRRIPIKVALLDQRVIAGIGNIYAAEALWRARIDPRRPAKSLERRTISKLLSSIRTVLRRASGARYSDGAARFDVYHRAEKPCRRCTTPISRITQAGRSTYFCPECQD